MDSSHVSLLVLIEDQVVFQSDGKWLYPLFDLEDFHQSHPFDMGRASVIDKIVGKAAALLLLRLGVGHVHGKLISDLAIKVFDYWELPFTFDQRVERIDCQTEALLFDVENIEEAYQILCARAKRC